jgi:phosphatidylinositol alpha-1,6-mannosyltransferase
VGKLLLLTLEFPPDVGGVGRMYRELCRAMPPGRAIVWAPPLNAAASAAASDAEAYTIRRSPLLGSWGWPRWLPTVFSLNAYLEQHDLHDVAVGQVLPLGTAVWLLAQWRPLRYAVFVHGMDVTLALRRPRKRWLLRQIFAGAEAVLAANRYAAGLVSSLGVPAGRLRLVYPPPALHGIPNAAAVERLRRRYGLANKPLLLTVGRLVRRKGHRLVLRALEEVWRAVPTARYVVVGEGPERARLEELASHLSRPAQVLFTGGVSDEEVAAWLSLSSVFIMTPETLPDGDVEGFGMVYLEAGAFGKPVIGSAAGGVPEAIVDGATGLLVPEGDAAAVAAAAVRLLSDRALARELGKRGRERALREFTARRSAAAVLEVFAENLR